MERHFDLLGLEVEDKVTGFKGVVESLSFDLYGCIQVVIKPRTGSDGNDIDGRWHDISRLSILSKDPIMKRPDYDLGYPDDITSHSKHISSGAKGCSQKP